MPSATRADPAARADARRFVLRHTVLRAPALCPEIRLHSVDELTPLWEATETELAALGAGLPYWAVAWPGGQALARYLLDHPRTVRGLSVLDLGCGGGVCALAAARAGARRVVGNDCDPYAIAALELNAELGGARVDALDGDLLGAAPPDGFDVVLAADLWFERALAERVTAWLHAAATSGARVLAGDPQRAYFPRRARRRLARYTVPTSRDLERDDVTPAGVFELFAESRARRPARSLRLPRRAASD